MWQQVTLSVLTGAATAIIGLWVKPWIDTLFARVRETQAYASEVVELRRQFEQSRRVMEAICSAEIPEGRYPLNMHFLKIAVPDDRIALSQDRIGIMSVENRAKAVELRVLLRNHNLEVEQIVELATEGNWEAYVLMRKQLHTRLSRFVGKICDYHPKGRWYLPLSVKIPPRWDEDPALTAAGRAKNIIYR